MYADALDQRQRIVLPKAVRREYKNISMLHLDFVNSYNKQTYILVVEG